MPTFVKVSGGSTYKVRSASVYPGDTLVTQLSQSCPLRWLKLRSVNGAWLLCVRPTTIVIAPAGRVRGPSANEALAICSLGVCGALFRAGWLHGSRKPKPELPRHLRRPFNDRPNSCGLRHHPFRP